MKIKKELIDIYSQIYISSVIWILFNLLGLIAIVAHYLNKDLINKTTLISLYRIKSPYISKNIAEIIIPILEEIEIIFYLEYFIVNNISFNNIY